MKIAGILRDKTFSPNSNDLKIMEGVKEQLIQAGHQVCFYEESALLDKMPSEKLIFSMARSEEALRSLTECQKEGAEVINPPAGIRNCQRSRITAIMKQTDACVPQSITFQPTDTAINLSDVPFPCWIKRSDVSAQGKGDVCFLKDKNDLQEHLLDFQNRNIQEAMLMEHIEGDIMKFYGVAGTPFFHCCYPTHSKFGLEQINGAVHRYTFSKEKLKQQTDTVALKAQVPVYGGDCIITAEGKAYIIDFNDWPSFSPCIEEASKAIAAKILRF